MTVPPMPISRDARLEKLDVVPEMENGERIVRIMGMTVSPYSGWTNGRCGEIEFQNGRAAKLAGSVDLCNCFRMSKELSCAVWCAACFTTGRIGKGCIESGCDHEGKWQEIAGPSAA